MVFHVSSGSLSFLLYSRMTKVAGGIAMLFSCFFLLILVLFSFITTLPHKGIAQVSKLIMADMASATTHMQISMCPIRIKAIV